MAPDRGAGRAILVDEHSTADTYARILFLFLGALTEADPGATAVLVDELDAGGLQSSAHCKLVSNCHGSLTRTTNRSLHREPQDSCEPMTRRHRVAPPQ